MILVLEGYLFSLAAEEAAGETRLIRREKTTRTRLLIPIRIIIPTAKTRAIVCRRMTLVATIERIMKGRRREKRRQRVKRRQQIEEGKKISRRVKRKNSSMTKRIVVAQKKDVNYLNYHTHKMFLFTPRYCNFRKSFSGHPLMNADFFLDG